MASGENPTPTYTNQGAFEGMTSLTNKTFATNNVTRIGTQTFKGCSSIVVSWKVELLIIMILALDKSNSMIHEP